MPTRIPAAGIVGAKLLFPNETVQHAGVVICQDGNPRHLYAGFPADHPAVNVSRRFQAVTAACMLVRREAFERAGGFDEAFRNCLEDIDLCLRPARPATRCTTATRACCITSSRSRAGGGRRRSSATRSSSASAGTGRVRRDDIDYYVADGLLKLRYRDVYPVGIELAPELAFVSGAGREAVDRLLEQQSREVVDLLKETVRLTALAAELGPAAASAAARPPAPTGRSRARRPSAEDAHRQLLERVREVELQIHDLQSRVAAPRRGSEEGNGGRRPGVRACGLLPLPPPDDRDPRRRGRDSPRRARPSRS